MLTEMATLSGAESNITFLIILVWVAVTLGMPRTLAPVAAALAGGVLTWLLNWSEMTSVEVTTELFIAGTVWGFSAVGVHKTITTLGEFREWLTARRTERERTGVFEDP